MSIPLSRNVFLRFVLNDAQARRHLARGSLLFENQLPYRHLATGVRLFHGQWVPNRYVEFFVCLSKRCRRIDAKHHVLGCGANMFALFQRLRQNGRLRNQRVPLPQSQQQNRLPAECEPQSSYIMLHFFMDMDRGPIHTKPVPSIWPSSTLGFLSQSVCSENRKGTHSFLNPQHGRGPNLEGRGKDATSHDH